MTSLEYAQMRLSEAVDTKDDRPEDEHKKMLADLLAIAFAATRPSPLPAA